MSSCTVVIPAYRESLQPLEQYSLQYSLQNLPRANAVFIAPQGLATQYYEETYPGVAIHRFSDEYFASIQGYNRLLLSESFYQYFGERTEFMLILQTDAIILRDELDQWCNKPYDYIGAPWPGGIEVSINLDCFGGPYAKRVKVHVGNGGLSLRRNHACAGLLQEFPQARTMFLQSGSSEDLFFSLMGSQSERFHLPNERIASLFSLELQPEHYYGINQQRPPMGGHAWWKYNQPFWNALLSTVPPELHAATAAGTPIVSGGHIK